MNEGWALIYDTFSNIYVYDEITNKSVLSEIKVVNTYLDSIFLGSEEICLNQAQEYLDEKFNKFNIREQNYILSKQHSNLYRTTNFNIHTFNSQIGKSAHISYCFKLIPIRKVSTEIPL